MIFDKDIFTIWIKSFSKTRKRDLGIYYVFNKQFKLKIHAEFENAASSNRKAPLKPHSPHEFTAKISAK